MKRTAAVIANAALFVPTAALTAPAEASTTGDVVTSCAWTKYGVTVRIFIRDMGTQSRIKVSHPDGTGRFHEPHVGSVRTTLFYRLGPIDGNHSTSFRSPSKRAATPSEVFATFKLANRKHHISLKCIPANH